MKGRSLAKRMEIMAYRLKRSGRRVPVRPAVKQDLAVLAYRLGVRVRGKG